MPEASNYLRRPSHEESTTRRLSVVVPAYNEEEVMAESHRRLRAACSAVCGNDFEIIHIEDGSRDQTWSMLSQLAHDDQCVVAVALSRNFGHQLALGAGLRLLAARAS